jgi:hypothetical protein
MLSISKSGFIQGKALRSPSESSWKAQNLPLGPTVVNTTDGSPETSTTIRIWNTVHAISRTLVRKVAYTAKKLALETGITGGHHNYVRFIVLGRSRVGSNFLLGHLNSHPHIIGLGEILRFEETKSGDVPSFLQSRKLLDLRNQDPVRFLEKEVFKKYPTRISAVGFKLFYYHAQNELGQTAWHYLKAKNEIKVIHLKRANILRTHLSWTNANSTNQWSKNSRVVNTVEPVTLDYEECLDIFLKTRNWENHYDAFFLDHPKTELWFEDLANNSVSEVGRIQDFLEVDYHPTSPTTFKQQTLPLSLDFIHLVDKKGGQDKLISPTKEKSFAYLASRDYDSFDAFYASL